MLCLAATWLFRWGADVATTHKHARGVEKPMFSLSKSMNFKILIISGRLGILDRSKSEKTNKY
jgi:hypothetical protein